MGLGLSCNHRSTASQPSLQLSAPQPSAWQGLPSGFAQMGSSWLRLRQQTHPAQSSKWSLIPEKTAGEMCLVTTPRVRLQSCKSCCPGVLGFSQGAPVPDTGITHQSWSTGDAQTYPADPRAKAYKLVSPAVSLICVSWRARSLRSTTAWPWLLNPYLHQGRGGSRLGYVCKPRTGHVRSTTHMCGLCSFAQHIQPKATTAPTKDLGPPKYTPSLTAGRLQDVAQQLSSHPTC